MRKLFYFIYSLIITTPLLHAQLNLTQLGKLTYPAAKGNLSDIWGYVDTTGKEYAIVGLQKGVSIVDVSNPSNPVEVFWIPGPTTIWRDIKTWGKFAYVTNEGGSGLLIINLSSLPNTSGITYQYYTGNNYPFTTAHNLYIDENGVCYIFGSNYQNGGAIMLDLTQNPWSPVELGVFDTYYLHDGVARGDTLWGGAVYQGLLVVIDVSNKSNPQIIGTKATPGNLTHNVWFSDDGQYVFTTDEVANGYITAYDVTNLSNITEVDRIQSSPGQNVIPHNTHYINGYLVTSYYRDGVTIHDVKYPNNMIEVGFFDTSPLYSGNGFNGCWGVYPWLPSGNIIASDIEEGLYILAPNYVRGCYLKGLVTDINNGQPISNAQVEVINANSANTTTNLNGEYLTGYAVAGFYDLVFSAPGFFNDTVFNVKLQNDSTTIVNVQLVPQTPFNFSGMIVEQNTNNPIPGAIVYITDGNYAYYDTTDANGNFFFQNIYAGNYDLVSGKWGYVTACTTISVTTQNNYLVQQLSKGYYDDFIFDFGWQVNSTATTGIWERAKPMATYDNNNNEVNPGSDVSADCGNMAYVTGNGGGAAGDDDVDGGYAVLTSPSMDLSSYITPVVSYSYRFYNSGGFNTPNDSLIIEISNGSQTQILDLLTHTQSSSQWKHSAHAIQIPLTNNMVVKVKTMDANPGHIVEAAFDYFRIYESTPSENITSDAAELVVYPNPAEKNLYVQGNINFHNLTWEILTPEGKLVIQGINKNSEILHINVGELDYGFYLLKLNDGKQNHTLKFLIGQ